MMALKVASRAERQRNKKIKVGDQKTLRMKLILTFCKKDGLVIKDG
jgi:hypothetical protein